MSVDKQPNTHLPTIAEATQDSLMSQIKSVKRSTAINESKALDEIRWEKYLRHKHKMMFFVFIIVVVAFNFYVYWTLGNLRRNHAYAYNWWENYYNDTKVLAYHPLGFPTPEGMYPQMTVPAVAVAADYPPLAFIQGLTFKSTVPTRNGALFLLKMVSSYGIWFDGPFKGTTRLAGIHWNGSPEQLRFAYIDKFLPQGPARFYGNGAGVNWGYIYASWNILSNDGKTPANPWSIVLWSDFNSFKNSPMLIGYYKNDARKQAFMRSLFSGGLCKVAMDWFDDNTDPDHVIDSLFGTASKKVKRKCSSSQLASSAIQTGSLSFMLVSSLFLATSPYLAVLLGAAAGAGGGILGATVLKPNCGYTYTAGEKPR